MKSEIKLCFIRPHHVLKEWFIQGEVNSHNVEITVSLSEIPENVREAIANFSLLPNSIHGFYIYRCCFGDTPSIGIMEDYGLSSLDGIKKIFYLEWCEKEINKEEMMIVLQTTFKSVEFWLRYYKTTPLWKQWYDYFTNKSGVNNVLEHINVV